MLFRQETNTRKALFQTFVTTCGVADNEYKTQVVDCEVTMEDLLRS